MDNGGDKMNKKKVIMLSVALLIIGLSVSFADSTPDIYYNDVKVEIKSNFGTPIINDVGVTMVPLEGFMSYYGTEIEYVSGTENIMITKKGNQLVFAPNEQHFYKNGFKILLGSMTFNTDGDLYIPLRRVMEVMGEEVIWNGEKRAIQIKSSDDLIAQMRLELNPLKDLAAKGDIIENRLEFDWPKTSEVDYFLLYTMNDKFEPVRTSKPIFPQESTHYRPGYFDVSSFKSKPFIEFKVSSVVDGVESELSELINISLVD